MFAGGQDVLDGIEAIKQRPGLTESGKPSKPIRPAPQQIHAELEDWTHSVLHVDQLVYVNPKIFSPFN